MSKYYVEYGALQANAERLIECDTSALPAKKITERFATEIADALNRLSQAAGNAANGANEARSKPRRNCDVGTPAEQSVRYEEFCFAHRSRERCCQDCPLLREPSCELAWAQMPYAEETAPARDIPLDIDHILAVGRELQASDTWHGATYDTVKLLCDTIEALRERGEGGFTPRKRVSKIGPADFTADRDASSGTGGGK